MRTEREGCNNIYMFRAIGYLIIFWGLSQFFTNSFAKLDETGVALLDSVITASEQFEAELQTGVEPIISR